MILGISGTGRKNGITYNAIEEILKSTKEEYEIISLSGKKINGCIACLACAKDNRCHVKDDFQEIQEKILKADFIVFGGADYFGTLNALSHATLERTFAFRHNDKFELEGKQVLIVSTSYRGEEENDVSKLIKRFFKYNKMDVVGEMGVTGYSQCYSCGQGHKCKVGNVYKDHGRFLESMEEATYPLKFNEQSEKVNESIKWGEKIKKLIEKKANL